MKIRARAPVAAQALIKYTLAKDDCTDPINRYNPPFGRQRCSVNKGKRDGGGPRHRRSGDSRGARGGAEAASSSSRWCFLIVPSPQKSRSNASRAEITRGRSEIGSGCRKGERGTEREGEGGGEETIGGSSGRGGRQKSIRDGSRAMASRPYPLQLFARATLIKQDNLLSYAARCPIWHPRLRRLSRRFIF